MKKNINYNKLQALLGDLYTRPGINRDLILKLDRLLHDPFVGSIFKNMSKIAVSPNTEMVKVDFRNSMSITQFDEFEKSVEYAGFQYFVILAPNYGRCKL